MFKPNAEEELKSKDVKLLRQEIVTMNHHIHRVLELTKSNTLDYNVCIYVFIVFFKSILINIYFLFSFYCQKLNIVRVFQITVPIIFVNYSTTS